jgi:hypothetical protein
VHQILPARRLGDTSPGKSLVSCAENNLINLMFFYYNHFSPLAQSEKVQENITLNGFFKYPAKVGEPGLE